MRKKKNEWEKVPMSMKSFFLNEIKLSIENHLKDLITKEVSRKIAMIHDFPLTVHQVATLTGRSEGNIYKMLQRERIPYTKTKNQVHISLKDLNSVLIQADYCLD